MVRLCFVCLGNICRSPTAEGIMLAVVHEAGLTDAISIDSAGTGAWHVGERADKRARAAAKSRGIDLPSRARQFIADDFSKFDYVLAMDESNRSNLLALDRSGAAENKIHLFRSFDRASAGGAEVPDPYYGGEDGFMEVFDICHAAAHGLLEHIRKNHEL